MGILWKILAVFGPVLMLVGYFQKVLALQIDQLTWIGIGNVCLLAGYLLFLKEERKKWRKQFLTVNPDWQKYEHLWKLYMLLAKGRTFLQSGLHGEQLEDWHEKVIKILDEWKPDYKQYYLLNDKPNLGHRICQLEQTLDWILG